MSVIEGFAVQKWIRDRGWTRETAAVAANKGGDDRRDDLRLIFNHLDATRRGKISLCAIRGALSMVNLSEDPARHAHLSESIVSCFCTSDQPKSAGGAVDFTQFADVMACQEQGRKFQTLQDELRSEGLAAAKAHFANIFLKEVVVRGLLDNGGAAGVMCSVFQMLFKAEGLAAPLSGRARKLRLVEEAVEDRKSRRLERKRAVQAKQKLVERFKLVKSNRNPVQVPSSLDEASKLPFSRVDAVPNASGVYEEEAEAPQSKRDPDGASPTARQRFRGRKEQPAPMQQNTTSRAEANVRLKKEAIRQASAVLGVHYVPPSPPSTTSPVARITDSFQGRAWWFGRSSSVNNNNSGSSSSGGGGTGFTKDDRSRGKVVANAAPGGFVRYPPVRRLRLRPQRPSPAVGLSRGNRGTPSSGVVVGDPDDPDNKGSKAFGVTSRRKDAIMKRTPLCGRSAYARLPSWASCHNSACDPGNEWNGVLDKSAAGGEQAPATPESPVRCGTGGANAAVPEQEEAPAAATPVRGRWEGHGSGFGPPETASLSVSTLSHSEPATATIITAVVPTATKVEHYCEPTTPGTGQGQIGSRISSNSSPATVPGTARHDAVAECGGMLAPKGVAEIPHNNPPWPDQGTAHRSPKRPTNPARKARSGSRSHGNGCVRDRGGAGGEGARAASAERWRRLYPNPWRTPLLVRCMRRPEPGATQPLHA